MHHVTRFIKLVGAMRINLHETYVWLNSYDNRITDNIIVDQMLSPVYLLTRCAVYKCVYYEDPHPILYRSIPSKLLQSSHKMLTIFLSWIN